MVSPNPAELAQLLQPVLANLVSNDNAVRSRAEEALNSQWVLGQPNSLVLGLVQIVQTSPDVHLRSFASILFRRIAFRPAPVAADKSRLVLWQSLQDETRQLAKSGLLAALTSESVVVALHKLSDTVAEVARFLWGLGEQWPELLQTLASCVQAEASTQRATVFRVFAAVPAVPLSQPIDALKPAFASGLRDSDSAVRLAALQACVAYMMEMEDHTRAQCHEWIPAMLSTMEPLLASGEESQLVDTFSSLVELAESFPKPFRPVMNDILTFCMQVSSNTQLEDSTRQSALELPLTLAEASPVMARKTPDFAPRFAPVALTMMAELDMDESDKSWYTTENLEEEDDDDEANYCLGEQALDRVARALGGKYVLPAAFQYIPNYLGSPKWPERHAGLMAISSIGEGCGRPMEKELDKILQLVMPYFKDPHPRVRYAACNCVGQLSTDFPETVQPQHHELVLSHLIPALCDAESPRVQAHAAAALVNFCEQATQAVLEPYLDTLLENLLALLNSPHRYVQEQAVTTIATVADSAEKKFIKYYSIIMPMLLNVLRQVDQKEYRLLRGKTIECATLIALAVGKDAMGQDIQELAQLLATSQQGVSEPDDPQVSYLLAAWARLCKVMGNDFTPYLALVMPPLLQSAAIKPDFAVLDSDEDTEAQYASEDGWEFVAYNGKQIGLRTSFLEEKCTAVEMLICYARQLGAAFQPYVQQVLDIVMPLLKFHFHEGVKTAAAHTLPQLLGCIHQNAQLVKQQQPADAAAAAEQYLIGVWTTICNKLLNAMFDEADPYFVAELYTSFSDCVQVLRRDLPVGPIPQVVQMSAEMLEQFSATVMTHIRGYCQRTQERREENQDGDDGGDNDGVIMDEEEATDESLMHEIAKALQQVLASHGQAYLPYFEKLMPILVALLQATTNTSARQWAICVFDDVIEYTGPASAHYQSHFLPVLIQGLTDAEADIRQASTYGIGVAAQFGGQPYAEACAHAANTLVTLIQSPEAKHADNMYVTDNAISALGKVCRFMGGSVDLGALLPVWYQALPVLHDEEECPAVYEYLLELLDQRHPMVMGAVDASTPTPEAVIRLVRILSELFVSEVTLPEALNNRLAQAFQACLGACPDQAKAEIWGALSERQRKVLSTKGWV
ncbi:importin subunit beta-3 [Dimargaris xerosporica]|nr:importin subunit beta-3 [Dimargaris xerosporica]